MTPAVGYTEMKDSGIEWVGMIPKDWDINILFQLVSQVKNKNKDLTETNLLSLSYGKIKRKNIDHTDGLIPASFDSYNIIDTGDIVLRLTDLQNDQTSLRVGRSTEKGIITSAYITLRPVNLKTSKFLYYLLHAFDIRKGFYGMGAGVRQGLTYDEVKVLKLPLPSISEQTAIATYLDTQCAKIDEITAEAKASIEDYKQWKASIIYEAVTKGLDPNAEMKDSGATWLGWIPDHWKLSKIGSLYSLRNEKVSDKDYPPLSVTMKGILPQLATAAKTDDGDNRKLVCAGDFAINSRSDRRGSCGISPYDGSVSLINTILTPRGRMHPDYYNWLFHTSLFADEFYKWGHGIVDDLWTTRWQEMKRILVTVPPYEEQAAIAAYLDSQCAKIDELSTEKQSLITDLESYKKSLIYEVVTGKRRVC